MAISEKLLDELLKDYKNPEDLIGKNGLLKELTKRLVERAIDGVDGASGLRKEFDGEPPRKYGESKP